VRLLAILIAPWFAATACHAELPTIEAIERQPDYVQTRQSRANHLEPKWGGRLGDAMAHDGGAAGDRLRLQLHRVQGTKASFGVFDAATGRARIVQ
jgi:hypothetical protein